MSDLDSRSSDADTAAESMVVEQEVANTLAVVEEQVSKVIAGIRR